MMKCTHDDGSQETSEKDITMSLKGKQEKIMAFSSTSRKYARKPVFEMQQHSNFVWQNL